MRTFYPILCGLAGLMAAGCGLFGGGEANIQRAKGYRVVAPSGWKVKETGVESDSTYVLPSGNVATVTSSCNRHSDAAPEVLTRQLLMGARNINFDRREKLVVDGHEGLFSALRATADGKSVFMNLFVVGKNKCVFDFSLISPQMIPAKDSQEFLGFIRSFEYGVN